MKIHLVRNHDHPEKCLIKKLSIQKQKHIKKIKSYAEAFFTSFRLDDHANLVQLQSSQKYFSEMKCFLRIQPMTYGAKFSLVLAPKIRNILHKQIKKICQRKKNGLKQLEPVDSKFICHKYVLFRHQKLCKYGFSYVDTNFFKLLQNPFYHHDTYKHCYKQLFYFTPGLTPGSFKNQEYGSKQSFLENNVTLCFCFVFVLCIVTLHFMYDYF